MKTTREEAHVMMEAELGVMQLQAKERQGLPATTRSWEKHVTVFSESLERTNLADTLISFFWLPKLGEKEISVVLASGLW